MTDIFLSYCREDQLIARRFAEGLQREGFSVWWDQALDAGETFDQVTEQALKDARAVVVLWSTSAVRSRWVRSEATQADRFHTLVPVMIEACDRPIMFELTHTADLTGWNGDLADGRWRGFIEGLRRFTDRSRSDSSAAIAPTGGQGRPPVAHAVASASAHAARRASGKPLRWGIAALALVALAVGVYWLVQHRPGATASGAIEASVAVLPFEDLSENRDQEYFADGISEEILNVLAGVQGLKVTARTSSFAFKGKTQDMRAIGEALDVAHVLEGSVRKSGERLRITAQLINARTGFHLWSKTYEREREDVFDIQADIARSVAESLQISLGLGELGSVPGGTRNVDAYEAMLSGTRGLLQTTPESLERAMDDLKRAVTLDPDFSYAWMRLWDVYRNAASFVPAPPGKSWNQLADETLAEARRRTPEAFFVLFGDIADNVGRGAWSEAEKLYDTVEATAARQGLQISSELNRGNFLALVGRFREAIVLLERARNRDPLNANLAAQLAETYAASGNFPAAFAEFDRGLKIENHVRLLGSSLVTALATRDPIQIRSRVDALVAQKGAGWEIHMAMKSLLDQPEKGLEELRSLVSDARSPQVRAAAGVWAAYFGDPETAFSLLRTPTLQANRTEFIRFWRPVARDVRKLPAFKELVREMGLVDYWREYGWPDLCHPVGGSDFECN